MNLGEHQKLDDRPVDYGEVRYVFRHTKGLLFRRFLHHTIYEKKRGRRNSTNEINNLRNCSRMKEEQALPW